MGQALERMIGLDAARSRALDAARSRALDAICALGVAAAAADLVIVTRLGAGGHAVAGRHGSLVEGVSTLTDAADSLETSLAGAASVEALTLCIGGEAVGIVLMARRDGGFGPRERAVLFRLRQVAEAQMAAEGVLEAVAAAAFHRIEAARA